MKFYTVILGENAPTWLAKPGSAWGAKGQPAWKGAHTIPASTSDQIIMSQNLQNDAETLRSQRQHIPATTPAATDYKDGANISANSNSELLGYTWAAISALEKERNIDQALSTLRRMQELLTLNLTGGLNHE